MQWIAVLLSSFLGAAIQSVTGFGSAVIMMLILPSFFGLLSAPALTGAINIGLSTMLAWHFRKKIQWKACIIPIISYLACSLSVISFVKNIDLTALTVVFGLFLITLAIYFFLKPDKTRARPTRKLGCFCGAVSGLCSGLFGIGGPMMAIYFLAVNDEKENYLGNIQFLFASTNIINLGMRISKGIYTKELIPFTLLGVVGAFLGKYGGLCIMEKLDTMKLRRCIYGFVAISGAVNLLKAIL